MTEGGGRTNPEILVHINCIKACKTNRLHALILPWSMMKRGFEGETEAGDLAGDNWYRKKWSVTVER